MKIWAALVRSAQIHQHTWQMRRGGQKKTVPKGEETPTNNGRREKRERGAKRDWFSL